MIVALSVYQVVLAIHIMAVVAAFGVLFAYPLLVGAGRRIDPRGLPLLHRSLRLVMVRLVSPGLLVVVLAGLYLAGKLDSFGLLYVQLGFAAAILLGGLAGGFLAPREAQLAKLAERDIGGGGGSLSDEYGALSRQVRGVGALAALIVLATIFVMTIQLGA